MASADVVTPTQQETVPSTRDIAEFERAVWAAILREQQIVSTKELKATWEGVKKVYTKDVENYQKYSKAVQNFQATQRNYQFCTKMPKTESKSRKENKKSKK